MPPRIWKQFQWHYIHHPFYLETIAHWVLPFFMHNILSTTGVYHILTLGINHPAPLNIFWGRANVYYIIHIWFMSCNILVSFSSCLCVPFLGNLCSYLCSQSLFFFYFRCGVFLWSLYFQHEVTNKTLDLLQSYNIILEGYILIFKYLLYLCNV